MNTEVSETIKARTLALGMQILEDLAQRRIISVLFSIISQ